MISRKNIFPKKPNNNDILFREIENCIPLRLFFHEIETNYNRIVSFFAEESQAFKSESSVQDEDVTDQSDDENNRDKKETFKVSCFHRKRYYHN